MNNSLFSKEPFEDSMYPHNLLNVNLHDGSSMVFHVDARLMQPGTLYLQDEALAFLNEHFPAQWKYAEITCEDAPDKSYIHKTLENSVQ